MDLAKGQKNELGVADADVASGTFTERAQDERVSRTVPGMSQNEGIMQGMAGGK